MTQVTVRKVVEGESHLVLRINMLSNGVEGELNDYAVLTPDMLKPARKANKPAFRIMQIWYGLVWYDVTFRCNGVEPSTLWTLARDCDSHTDFRSFGGLIDGGVYDHPPVGDFYGTLMMSTNGFGPAGSQGSIVLELRKTN